MVLFTFGEICKFPNKSKKLKNGHILAHLFWIGGRSSLSSLSHVSAFLGTLISFISNAGHKLLAKEYKKLGLVNVDEKF